MWDTEIDSHTHDMPQAFSFASDVYEGMGADLSADGTLSVTITVTGANLAAGTFKLHLDGGEFEVTETVTSATEISFTLTRGQRAYDDQPQRCGGSSVEHRWHRHGPLRIR